MEGYVKVDPVTGDPYIQVGTYADRMDTLREMYRDERTRHQSATDALSCLVNKIQHQIIAECAASTMGESDPDAEQVGDALAHTVLNGSRVNIRMLQLLGNVADLYANVLEGIGLPPRFNDQDGDGKAATDG